MTVPTWAEGDVAELGLLLGALAGVPTELGGFAGAGPVPVASPTSGRAQAPRRPLVPRAMHCKGSRRSGEKVIFFLSQRKSEEVREPTGHSFFPPGMSSMWEAKEQTNPKCARGTSSNFLCFAINTKCLLLSSL